MVWVRRLLWLAAGWRAFGPVISPRFPPGQEHPWRVPARTVFAGDRELLVRQEGPEDAPDVVLIHGLGGSSLAEWYAIGPLLAERFRLTIVDHRSHGLSPKVVDRFEIEDVADDVAAAMGALGMGPSNVVGYSMGGAIAQSLAYRHPHLVRRLAVIGSFSHHPPAHRRVRLLGAILTRAWERVTGFGTPEVRAGYLLAVGAVARRHSRWLWEETHRREPESGAAASFALLRFDSRDWARKLTQPALVVIPTADQLVPPAWQYELADRLSDARVVEVAGARHEAPITHPEPIAGALVEFFEKD